MFSSFESIEERLTHISIGPFHCEATFDNLNEVENQVFVEPGEIQDTQNNVNKSNIIRDMAASVRGQSEDGS